MNDDAVKPDKMRGASSDIIRNRINQIFDHVDRPMIDQIPRVPTEEIATPPPEKKTPESVRTPEQYHASWQKYYQKYYENYYVDAVKQQNRDFNQKLSEIAATKTNGAQPQLQPQPAQTVDEKVFPVVKPNSKITGSKEAIKELQSELVEKIKTTQEKARKSRHFVPAICAIAVIILILFIQYNQLLFAQINAFITPGAMTDQTIIIGTGASDPVGPDPRVVIPKINVTAPVIYGLTDLSEHSAQEALKRGTIHYPIYGANATPGQKGNTVILGHSSSDWFSDGQYKFIFVQLNKLAVGDLFYLDYEGVRYTYKVFKTEVINPNQVEKLNLGGEKPYATLVTCDPPGTAFYRLVIYAEQISPDPNDAKIGGGNRGTTINGNITGNPPTLWERIFGQ